VTQEAGGPYIRQAGQRRTAEVDEGRPTAMTHGATSQTKSGGRLSLPAAGEDDHTTPFFLIHSHGLRPDVDVRVRFC